MSGWAGERPHLRPCGWPVRRLAAPQRRQPGPRHVRVGRRNPRTGLGRHHRLRHPDRIGQLPPNWCAHVRVLRHPNGDGARRHRPLRRKGAAVTDELVLIDPAPPTLFGPTNPEAVLDRIGEIATVLMDVVEKRKLYAPIGGRKYITVEGWTTLGAMLGVTPHVVDVRVNENDDGYVATVEARTLDGRTVGTAQAECSRSEKKWADADLYAIRSMAQTRAVSRTLRAALGMVVVFAGYEATPAEEMPTEPSKQPKPKATGEQMAELAELLVLLEDTKPESDWRAWARAISGGDARQLTHQKAAVLIERCKQALAEIETPDPDEDDDEETVPEPPPPADPDEPDYEFKAPPGVQTPLE